MRKTSVCVLSRVWLFATPWTVAHQALSMGFPRQEYWSGLPCPSPGDFSDPRIKPTSLMSPALAGGFFTTSATWETQKMCVCAQLCLTYWDPLACSLPGSSVHKILQARILEWVAISSFRESSQPRDWTCLSYVFCIDRQILYRCATWEASWL